MSPVVHRIARYALMSLGGSMVISAAVNVYGGAQLPDLLAEFEITPAEFFAPMIAVGVIGFGLFLLGLFWRTKA